MALDLTDLMLAVVSALAALPFMLTREWATAVVVPPLHRAAPNTWMTGPQAYESFASGGVRALIDRSPMRYDVAIYLGGAS
jgi:hypothetical protein